MTDVETAKLALEFMKRVDLKGGEVQAWVAVNNWLQVLANPPQPNLPHPKDE